jgi:hypothetical protein
MAVGRIAGDPTLPTIPDNNSVACWTKQHDTIELAGAGAGSTKIPLKPAIRPEDTNRPKPCVRHRQSPVRQLIR